jgi:3-hydroxy acid dehydrogenase / malonic semialdehyde reductase
MSEVQWAAGRVVAVTGATAGFGEAIARRFHTAGARVIATGRRAERLQALSQLGERIHASVLDVRHQAAVQAWVDGLPEGFAAIDLLVNSAGLAAGLGKAQEADLDDWNAMVDTNCRGLMYVTRAVLPGMVERGRGHIINMGSIAGSYPYPGGNVYGATKAFVRQFSLNLRCDLLGTPIRVTNIEPGMAETEFSVVRFHGDEAKAAKVYEGMTPLSADDIAAIVEATVRLPAHVNLNTIEVMPVAQAFSPFAVHREA